MAYLIIVLVLVALALIAGGIVLLRPRRRAPSATLPTRPPAPSALPPTAPASQDGDTATVTSAPAAPVAEGPVTEAEAAPQPLAGRMTRLRGRLARSQSGFGSVLLGLLSRDGLDDQGWQEIEDTLVGADLGAAPAGRVRPRRRPPPRRRPLPAPGKATAAASQTC